MPLKCVRRKELQKCRLCLCDDKLLIHLFEASGLFTDVAKAIMEVLQYEVFKDDRFPPFICSPCSDKLWEFKAFKEKCDEAKESFETFLSKIEEPLNNHEEPISISIKEEDEITISEDSLLTGSVSALERSCMETQEAHSSSQTKDDYMPINLLSCIRGGDEDTTENSKFQVFVESIVADNLGEEEDEGSRCVEFSTGCHDEPNAMGHQTDHMVNCERVSSAEETHQICRRGEGMRGSSGNGRRLRKSKVSVELCGLGNSEVVNSPTNIVGQGAENGETMIGRRNGDEEVTTMEINCATERENHPRRVINGEEPADDESFAEERGRYRCKTCRRVFLYKSILSCHELTHFTEGRFVCDTCDKVFFHRGICRRHVLGHVQKIFAHQCKYCGRQFKYMHRLLPHESSHERVRKSVTENVPKPVRKRVRKYVPKPFKGHVYKEKHVLICEICRKGFYTRERLIAHLPIHAAGRVQECQICKKCFLNDHEYQRHLRTHQTCNPGSL